jgi:hypothetical protein
MGKGRAIILSITTVNVSTNREIVMLTKTFLASSGVRQGAWPTDLKPVPGVYCTAAGQFIASYSDLKRFQSENRTYFGWHAHHIVESQDLQRLGVVDQSAPRNDQVCVLLPERSHIGRINSILRRQNPDGVAVTASELRGAYSLAYSTMGDYCGGGEEQIRQELLAIVGGTLRNSGVL